MKETPGHLYLATAEHTVHFTSTKQILNRFRSESTANGEVIVCST